MGKFTVYGAPQSTCSQRVRYALHAKAIRFEEVKLDLFSGDQLKPDYLQLNPNGVVPTLVHGENVVTDSSVILEYLDEADPSLPKFAPEDAAGRAKVRSMMRYIDEILAPSIRAPSYNLAFLPHFQSMSQQEFEELANSKPLRREFLMKMGRTGFPEAEMQGALGKLRRGVVRMAEWLAESGGPWLRGECISFADILAMPVIVRMDDINLSHVWDDLPAIGGWLRKVENTPAFSPTFYAGSLLTDKYQHLAHLKKPAGRDG
ncbi:MAG: glutathione S-transferase family protein [Albidovulum sp.]|nr:glutathione S-transferase family protein [Albidovulum sp.]